MRRVVSIVAPSRVRELKPGLLLVGVQPMSAAPSRVRELKLLLLPVKKPEQGRTLTGA